MDDLISRQAAIDELDKGAWGVEWDKTLAKTMIESLPSAQQERIIYGNMSDEEFEKWLYGHGICSPNIRESIPCDAVPLLIDNAISELPSARPEQRWIPCSERLPDKNGKYLCSIQSNFKRKKIMRISTTDFESGINRWSPDCMAFKDRVIAWMPLPEPYKEDDDDALSI